MIRFDALNVFSNWISNETRARLPLVVVDSGHDDRFDAFVIIAHDLEKDLKSECFCHDLLDDLLLLKQVAL